MSFAFAPAHEIGDLRANLDQDVNHGIKVVKLPRTCIYLCVLICTCIYSYMHTGICTYAMPPSCESMTNYLGPACYAKARFYRSPAARGAPPPTQVTWPRPLEPEVMESGLRCVIVGALRICKITVPSS